MNIIKNQYKICQNCSKSYPFSEFCILSNGKIYTLRFCKSCEDEIRLEKAKISSIKNANSNLKNIVSGVVRATLKKNNNISYVDVFDNLPYTPEQLKIHLESQFESWMTWYNWGVYCCSYWDDNDIKTWQWQIDHIVPQSKFQYSSIFDKEFQLCWSLDNLRPLSAKQNLLDGVRRVRH